MRLARRLARSTGDPWFVEDVACYSSSWCERRPLVFRRRRGWYLPAERPTTNARPTWHYYACLRHRDNVIRQRTILALRKDLADRKSRA